jgi:hypothetical protein
MVRQVKPPRAARALTTLPRVDYADATVAAVADGQGRTGEQWARVVLEEAPAVLKRTCQAAWAALGLELAWTRSDRRVLGWPVRRSSPDHVLLAAGSPLGLSAEVLIQRRKRTILLATFLQHKNPVARAVWAGIAPGHRQMVRRLLEHAASS